MEKEKGKASNSNSTSQRGDGSLVVLNVYDLTPINNYMYWFGFGIFHSGIEGEPSILSLSLFQHDLCTAAFAFAFAFFFGNLYIALRRLLFQSLIYAASLNVFSFRLELRHYGPTAWLRVQLFSIKGEKLI